MSNLETKEGPVTETKTPLRSRSAEQLVAPAKARAAAARARSSRKVTAQEILARREAKAAARQRSAHADRAGTVALVLGFSMLLGAGATLTMTQQAETAAARASADNARITALLRAEVARLSQAVGPDATEDAVVAARATLAEVRDVAQRVADEQNEFATLLAANPEEEGNGAPSKGYLDGVENRRDLVEFFDEATFVVPEAEIFTPTSLFTIDADQVDPRLAWYTRDLDAGEARWEVASVRAGEGESASAMQVMWLCRDEASGELLAWARATWSSERAVFDSLTVGTTSIGDRTDAQRPWVDADETTEDEGL